METTKHISDLIPEAIQRSQTIPKSKVTGWKPRLDAYEPSLVLAANVCAEMVAAMERGDEPYWVTLQGVNGWGKTFLMDQVFPQAKRINPGNPANNPVWPPSHASRKDCEYEASRPYALRYDEGGLASRMRNGDYTLPRSLAGDYFVAMDEVGMTRDPTNYIAEAISVFCDVRLHKWTMLCTNFTMAEIAERMDARISSRILRDENKLVCITAGDYALRR